MVVLPELVDGTVTLAVSLVDAVKVIVEVLDCKGT